MEAPSLCLLKEPMLALVKSFMHIVLCALFLKEESYKLLVSSNILMADILLPAFMISMLFLFRYETEDNEEVCQAMEGIAEIFLQGSEAA